MRFFPRRKDYSEEKNWASYGRLSRKLGGFLSPEYVLSPDKKYFAEFIPDFIQLSRLNSWVSKDEKVIPPSNWKFHISVASQDVALAWDTIVAYLQERGINAAKVVRAAAIQGHSLTVDPSTGNPLPQAGKMIVLYSAKGDKTDESPEFWQETINGIEHRLATAGVRPGANVITDKKITNSMYCYYRSDRITKALDGLFKDILAQSTSAFVKKNPPFKNSQTLVNALLAQKILHLDAQEMQAMARKALGEHYTDDEIDRIIPTEINELLGSGDPAMALRIKLLALPIEKRYKHVAEEDVYAPLHIAQPEIIKAALDAHTQKAQHK